MLQLVCVNSGSITISILFIWLKNVMGIYLFNIVRSFNHISRHIHVYVYITQSYNASLPSFVDNCLITEISLQMSQLKTKNVLILFQNVWIQVSTFMLNLCSFRCRSRFSHFFAEGDPITLLKIIVTFNKSSPKQWQK